MKFSALALDYDGTIARDGALDPDVRTAIGELRGQGIVVAIVTGRILDHLRQVAGDLHFVDAVVAENGAAITFPASGYSTTIGPPPSAALLDDLRRADVRVDSGRVIVEADARDAGRILKAIQRLELPLALLFNRGRVMILPQAISKATGLREALTILRLSRHNVIGVGDAENDHELLRACEIGVAVAWGSEALKASADYVLAGDGPRAVAGYIRELARAGRLPAPVKPRRRLRLGHTDDGHELSLAVRGRNVLVAGDPNSGKSWVVGLLCEQLILHGYCLCILDPEGDYVSLEALPGVQVFGGVHPLPSPRDLLSAMRHPDVSAVIDLSHASHENKLDYLRAALPGLARLRRHTGLPHRVVVDEAHHFLHGPDAEQLLDLDRNGYTLATYRASQVHPRVLDASEVVVVTRESDPREVAALHALCRTCDRPESPQAWEQLLGGLVVGEAVVLMTEESGCGGRRIRLAPRLTPHVRHLAKYIDVPVPDQRAFVFWSDGALGGGRARTLREFVEIVERSQLAALDGHLRRHDFSRWVAEVFGDHPLAKAIRRIEDDHHRAPVEDVGVALGHAVRARYELREPVPPPRS